MQVAFQHIGLLIFGILGGIQLGKYIGKKQIKRDVEKDTVSCKSEQIEIEEAEAIDISALYKWITINEDGLILDASKNIEEILAGDGESIKGKQLSELTIAEDYAIECQNIHLTIENHGFSPVMDKRFIRPTGQYRWFECTYYYQASSKSVLIACVDIHERKGVENSLRQSYELGEVILNTLYTDIIVFDKDENIVLATKEKTFDKELSGKCTVRQLCGDDEELLSAISTVKKGIDKQIVLRREYKEGDTRRKYLVSIECLKEINGGLISYMDITNRAGILQKLRTGYKSPADFLNRLPCAIIIQKDSKITYCNGEAGRLLKYKDSDEILEKALFSFIPVECRRSYIETFYGKINTNISGVEQILICADGTEISVEIDRSKTSFNNEIMDIYTIRDISERKKIESYELFINEKNKLLLETQEYDRIKTEFFSNISHELRTPINIISSTIQLMALNNEQEDNQNIDKYIRIIKQNCARLSRLINNLIDISKIDSGFYMVKGNYYNIIYVVEELSLSIVNYIESKNIEFVFDTTVEEAYVIFDLDSMERIILNLISNAVKFTPEYGKISVTIYESEGTIVIRIKDTGIGIAEDKKNLIFERFRQIDKSLDRKQEGSGIGLSIVKSLVELQGGTITVESCLGKGSEFILQFPTVSGIEGGALEENYRDQINLEKVDMEFSDIYYSK